MFQAGILAGIPYIGGFTPFFSAVTRPVIRVPSGFFCATVVTAAPGLSKLRSLAT
jgi:hypothetical protein